MAITQQELGRRIRAAREVCRVTQEEVGNRLGVSRSAVVQLEAGNRAVSSLELDRLARLFARDIREFVAETFDEEDRLEAIFRAEPAVIQQSEVMDALRDCLALAREHANLEQLVGVERGPVAVVTYELPLPVNRWDGVQQGEWVAAAERRRLGLGGAPLPDLLELLETQGVRTEIVDLPDDVSGLTLTDRQVSVLVVVNRAHHVLRRRFSAAHECAHVLVDRDQFGLVSRTSERDDLLEVRANAFAANFLLPEDGVRQFIAGLGKGKPSRVHAEVFDEAGSLDVEGRTAPGSQEVQLYDVVQLADHFRVSRPAALYRLRNLRLVTEVHFERLKAQDEAGTGKQLADRLGLPEPDHEGMRNRFHHRFLALALEAYRREEISRGKLAELASMVDLTRDELARLIDDAGLADDARPPNATS